jgi:T-complex protein 1 subunit alpha
MHSNLCIKKDEINDEILTNVCRTSMSSKIVGGDSDFFSEMCVSAMKRVGNLNAKNKMIYPIAAVNIIKQHGASTRESFLVNGYGLRMSTASQQMKKSITNAKIACIDFNLNKFRMALGITVQCEDVSKLAEVRQREMDITKERIQKIIDAGANVIITTKGIDDFAQKFLVEKGVMGIRRVEKNDMRKIAKLIGAELV